MELWAGYFLKGAYPGRGQWAQFTACFKGAFCGVEREPTAGADPKEVSAGWSPRASLDGVWTVQVWTMQGDWAGALVVQSRSGFPRNWGAASVQGCPGLVSPSLPGPTLSAGSGGAQAQGAGWRVAVAWSFFFFLCFQAGHGETCV